MVLSTTPVMMSGKDEEADDEHPRLPPVDDDPADVERDGAADARQTPRTMKKAIDFRRPPDAHTVQHRTVTAIRRLGQAAISSADDLA